MRDKDQALTFNEVDGIGYVPAKNETFEEPKVKNNTDVILSDELYWYVPIFSIGLPPELLRGGVSGCSRSCIVLEKLTKPHQLGSSHR